MLKDRHGYHRHKRGGTPGSKKHFWARKTTCKTRDLNRNRTCKCHTAKMGKKGRATLRIACWRLSVCTWLHIKRMKIIICLHVLPIRYQQNQLHTRRHKNVYLTLISNHLKTAHASTLVKSYLIRLNCQKLLFKLCPKNNVQILTKIQMTSELPTTYLFSYLTACKNYYDK